MINVALILILSISISLGLFMILGLLGFINLSHRTTLKSKRTTIFILFYIIGFLLGFFMYMKVIL